MKNPAGEGEVFAWMPDQASVSVPSHQEKNSAIDSSARSFQNVRVIESALRDSELDNAAFRVLCALLIFANFKTGECFPSLKKIADILGISRQAVHRQINVLDSAGYIIRHARIRGNGSSASSLYKIKCKPSVDKSSLETCQHGVDDIGSGIGRGNATLTPCQHPEVDTLSTSGCLPPNTQTPLNKNTPQPPTEKPTIKRGVLKKIAGGVGVEVQDNDRIPENGAGDSPQGIRGEAASSAGAYEAIRAAVGDAVFKAWLDPSKCQIEKISTGYFRIEFSHALYLNHIQSDDRLRRKIESALAALEECQKTNIKFSVQAQG